MFDKVGVHGSGSSQLPASSNTPTTLICFSHLRWDFVFQRPQHLMSRFANDMTVVFWEEPVDIETLGARMRLHPYNNVSEKRVLFTPQFFDPEELAILRGRVRDGFTFVDVGANIGAYALFVGVLAGPAGRIPWSASA